MVDATMPDLENAFNRLLQINVLENTLSKSSSNTIPKATALVSK